MTSSDKEIGGNAASGFLATWSPSPSSVASTFWQICIVYDICVHICIYYIHMYTRVETHTHTNTDTNMEKTLYR